MVHRMIKMVCNKSIQQAGEWKELMLKSINTSNEVELKALSAEREYIKLKQLRWLNERIGETFEGRISGVVNFGIFVELQSSLAEGLIHIDTMEDDDYSYDEDRYCLRGRKSRHEYRLGDKVNLKVIAVLFEKQRANFILEN
jgi:ribonuclease R